MKHFGIDLNEFMDELAERVADKLAQRQRKNVIFRDRVIYKEDPGAYSCGHSKPIYRYDSSSCGSSGGSSSRC